MSRLVEIGEVPWSRAQMRAHLEEFAEVYARRPIQDNTGGMKAPHMFLAWFVLKVLQPQAIIENGVWLGQGTWLFEQACPQARLYCIDPNLARIRYRSKRAEYFDKDFTELDWSELPPDETLVFFDDHQNAYRRVVAAHWAGLKHLMFEDNYPPGRGDCYSLKKAFAGSGTRMTLGDVQSLKGKLKFGLYQALGATLFEAVAPNAVDAARLRQHLEIYRELPPVFRTARTYWGDAWGDVRYPTPEPMLGSVEAPYQQIFQDEAVHYNWICYAKLRDD